MICEANNHITLCQWTSFQVRLDVRHCSNLFLLPIVISRELSEALAPRFPVSLLCLSASVSIQRKKRQLFFQIEPLIMKLTLPHRVAWLVSALTHDARWMSTLDQQGQNDAFTGNCHFSATHFGLLPVTINTSCKGMWLLLLMTAILCVRQASMLNNLPCATLSFTLCGDVFDYSPPCTATRT